MSPVNLIALVIAAVPGYFIATHFWKGRPGKGFIYLWACLSFLIAALGLTLLDWFKVL
ncbi:hypothetical protein CCP3SC15_450017 [Gammaproteobacteria bacterium]